MVKPITMFDSHEIITSELVASSVVRTCLSARAKADKCDFAPCAELAQKFLIVLALHDIIDIDEDMTTMEQLEMGMYAANLYLSACARMGAIETARITAAEKLEKSFSIS